MIPHIIKDLEVHRPVAPAPGLFHQLRVSRGAELASEIAGVAGVDVDDVGRPQGQGVFQFDPVVNIDPGNGFRVHGQAPWKGNGILI